MTDKQGAGPGAPLNVPREQPSKLKAIPTRYAGCHFRSRLEARWAVFFDAMNYAWEYEPQGYDLPTGRYLPDFRLVDDEMWIEVKGGKPTSREIRLACELAHTSGMRCLILSGDVPRRIITAPPWVEPDPVYGAGFPGIQALMAMPNYVVIDNDGPTIVGTHHSCTADHAAKTPVEYWNLESVLWGIRGSHIQVQAALDAARSARFEHGQSGAPGVISQWQGGVGIASFVPIAPPLPCECTDDPVKPCPCLGECTDACFSLTLSGSSAGSCSGPDCSCVFRTEAALCCGDVPGMCKNNQPGAS